MSNFALDYGTLHEARKDLHDLANRIGPTLKDSVFEDMGSGTSDVAGAFGNDELDRAFRTFYRVASGPMSDAEDRLRKLGDMFGGVADSFFNTDAEISQGLGVMGGRLGLSEWRRKKAAWDFRNANSDKCVPDANGKMPDFCSATDPGPPPTTFTVKGENGQVDTVLTLDQNNNVTKETTTVTHDNQKYTSVTTYSEDGKSYTTVTTYADNTTATSTTTYGANPDSYTTETVNGDGTKSTTVVEVKEDGSGTMTVTDAEGNKTTYQRKTRWELWTKV
ncbi:hypothetical protein AB0K60_20450 [Thermopolyspora sp. NPDC052614]|uniref:hypothetical protein n=1 Tax=Thermopolyspora sp. NPDC052614 TaxID=3155682 RepID=UPI0034467D82